MTPVVRSGSSSWWLPRAWRSRCGVPSKPGNGSLAGRVCLCWEHVNRQVEQQESAVGSTAVVAMDGPSGSGKSSTSRGVAVRLGLRYLDTGAMYRAMTWWMLRAGVDVHAAEAVAARCSEPLIEAGTDPEAPTISVDGQDVAVEIRQPDVN